MRAVASDARVIVMDEPTSSLTSVETTTLHRMPAHASESSFWRDVPNTQSLGSTAEAAIRDYSDLTT